MADPHTIEGLVAALESGVSIGPASEPRSTSMTFPLHRPRRLRRTAALRALVRETDLAPRHLIAPLFVKEGIDEPAPIASMPGQAQHTLESLRKEAVTSRRGA